MNCIDFDTVVIGAGVIGLAVARALALPVRSEGLLLVEAESAFGSHTSARNSEVIHAGIYYRPDSLKGRLCVSGRQMLYDYCRIAGVPHRKIGKLIIAVDDSQIARLKALKKNAETLGTDDLGWLDGDDIARLEPAIRCVAALYSPSTGIIDSHQYMLSLLADAEEGGATYAPRTRVTNIEPLEGAFRIALDAGDGAEYHITCRRLVNCAGHGAWDVAAPLYAAIGRDLPGRHFAKGSYFRHGGKAPFSHLIYPLPIDGGLGIHVTLDQGGAVRYGPDVEWVDQPDYQTPDYQVNAARRDEFVAAIRHYYPDIRAEDIEPDFAGVRPRTAPPGQDNDFLIDDLSGSGGGNSVHLFGIDSPGLTCSLAIAGEVADRLGDMSST